jgi:NAD(P)-dependent dehydrogenase (short-subunit alcohol dehydrogenase family)
MTKLLHDKAALVTGGGQGVGLAVAVALAVDGARVLVVSRSEERGRNAAAKVREAGGLSAWHVADLSRPEAAAEVVEKAVSEFGGLDIVVHCAGVFVWKKFLDLTQADWEETIATNLSAAFHLSQAAARVMVEQGRGGAIIHMSSIHGSCPDPNVAAHCASKFGLVGLTRSAAEALRPYDIRVNAIAPGSIEPESGGRRGGSPQEKVTQGDVASMTVYLASDLARTITGATIDLFGSTRTVIKA